MSQGEETLPALGSAQEHWGRAGAQAVPGAGGWRGAGSAQGLAAPALSHGALGLLTHCSSSFRNAQTSSPKGEVRSWPSTPGCPSWVSGSAQGDLMVLWEG